jgi:hypothetical protein
MSIDVLEKFDAPVLQGPFVEVATYDIVETLPVLVVGSRFLEKQHTNLLDQRILDDKRWVLFNHQSAGIACHHPYFLGKAYQLNDKGEALEQELSEKWFDTSLGAFGVSLSELVEYRDVLKRHDDKLNCESSYTELEEAVYPLDFDHENINSLIVGEVEKDPDELVLWKPKLEQVLGCIGRWGAWIITENSD